MDFFEGDVELWVGDICDIGYFFQLSFCFDQRFFGIGDAFFHTDPQ